MTVMPTQILVLENEAFARSIVRALKAVLGEGSAAVQSGALVTARDALRVVQTNPFITGVSVDFNLFGTTTGVDFAVDAKAVRPDLLLILFTGNADGARRHPRYRDDLFVRELEKPMVPTDYAQVWLSVLREAGKIPGLNT